MLKKKGTIPLNYQFGDVMEIKRDIYLQKLINRMHNGLIKVITGIRRSGKVFSAIPAVCGMVAVARY